MLAGAAGTTSPAPGRRERATPTEGAPRCRSLCLVLTPPHTCPKSGFHYRPSNTGKVVCSKLKPRELASPSTAAGIHSAEWMPAAAACGCFKRRTMERGERSAAAEWASCGTRAVWRWTACKRTGSAATSSSSAKQPDKRSTTKGHVDARKISSCIPPSLPRPQRSSERERVCVYLYTFRGFGSCAKGCS